MFDSESVLFAGGRIDRAAHLRGRADKLMTDPSARTLVMWRGKVLFDGDEVAPRLAWLPLDAPILNDSTEAPIFLGLDGEAPRFAHDISGWVDPAQDAETGFADVSVNHHPAAPGLGFLDLRGAMSRLEPSDAGDAAAAKGIFGWHDSHRFCARCGAPSEVSQAGWQRICTSCGGSHFPRTDPVVIMLVLHKGRLLMGRSPAWPEDMYSLLAGFMEPGESIEAAVRREVMEETGVPVGRVGYLASQPWPFPASLMIGCWAEALSDEITLDPVELEDAFWITREDLLAERSSPTPKLRPARRGAIAHFIIEHWLGGRLDLPI